MAQFNSIMVQESFAIHLELVKLWKEPVDAKVEIQGLQSITIPQEGERYYNYYSLVFDQYNDLMVDYIPRLIIKADLEGVSFHKRNRLCIKYTAKLGKVVLKAKYKDVETEIEIQVIPSFGLDS